MGDGVSPARVWRSLADLITLDVLDDSSEVDRELVPLAWRFFAWVRDGLMSAVDGLETSEEKEYRGSKPLPLIRTGDDFPSTRAGVPVRSPLDRGFLLLFIPLPPMLAGEDNRPITASALLFMES